MRLHTDFETFYGRIILGKPQNDRIASAATALSESLTKSLDIDADDVFLQGSFANGTAIKPDPEQNDGEYDVDLVTVRPGDAAEDAEDALSELREAIASDGNYKDKIEDDPDRPCLRLRYADEESGGFHVDVVAARRAESDSPPIEIARPGVGWRGTDPEGYRQWCEDQGDEFARAVQMLKRWRDHNQDARGAVKSIVLQVLIHNHLEDADNDADRIAGTLRGIGDFLQEDPDNPPELCNPVLQDENLTERWPVEDYKEFRQVVADAADLAEKACKEGDVNPSRKLWVELFGKDFPGPDSGGEHSAPQPSGSGSGFGKSQKAPRVEWGR